MKYVVKSAILGFEDVEEVELIKIDDTFSILKNCKNGSTIFTLINPYSLREYSFDVPTDVKVLMDITENSKMLVYCVVVLQNPLEDSKVNFLAPIVFNNDNNTCAQIKLKMTLYPDFKLADDIKNYIKSE